MRQDLTPDPKLPGKLSLTQKILDDRVKNATPSEFNLSATKKKYKGFLGFVLRLIGKENKN